MSNFYSTSDLGCAAFLYAKGSELERIDRTDTKRAVFVLYSEESDLNALADQFFLGKTVMMSPQRLLQSMKHLKSALYQ